MGEDLVLLYWERGVKSTSTLSMGRMKIADSQ